jgi:hypothetical protein
LRVLNSSTNDGQASESTAWGLGEKQLQTISLRFNAAASLAMTVHFDVDFGVPNR